MLVTTIFDVIKMETELEILKAIALNGKFCQYDLPKAIKKSYRTVLRCIKRLEQNRLIKLAGTEPSAKKGKERKLYRLTHLGLVKVLGAFPLEIDKSKFRVFDKIAEANESLLIFFNYEYWSYLRTKDLGMYIAECICNVCKEISEKIDYLLRTELISLDEWNEEYSREAIEKNIVRFMIMDLIPPLVPTTSVEIMYEFQFMPELRRYIDEIMDEMYKEAKETLEAVKLWKEAWDTIKKAPYGLDEEKIAKLVKYSEKIHLRSQKEPSIVNWRKEIDF